MGAGAAAAAGAVLLRPGRQPRQRSPPELLDVAEPAVGRPVHPRVGRDQGRVVAVDPGRELTAEIMGAHLSYAVLPQDPGVTRLVLKVAMRTSRWRRPPSRSATS